MLVPARCWADGTLPKYDWHRPAELVFMCVCVSEDRCLTCQEWVKPLELLHRNTPHSTHNWLCVCVRHITSNVAVIMRSGVCVGIYVTPWTVCSRPEWGSPQSTDQGFENGSDMSSVEDYHAVALFKSQNAGLQRYQMVRKLEYFHF